MPSKRRIAAFTLLLILVAASILMLIDAVCN